MNVTPQTAIPVLTVFLQGLFSFFSPCVLPLVPLYMGYLSGGAKIVHEDGSVTYPRKKVMVNTLFFILGVSFAFFALGLGFSAAGQFFRGNRVLFARLGGLLIIFFGLFQLGLFGRGGAMEREARLPLRLEKLAMNPLTALLLGFTFSFAWTPCVGPALASVLVIASSASLTTGLALIGVYTLGFVLPFLGVGLFTGALLDLFRKHRNVVKYTVKAGGVLMILMGVMMFTGWMNGVTAYLSSFGAAPPPAASQSVSQTPESGSASNPSSQSPSSSPKTPAPDFTLTDQFGNSHTLSDYKGKVVFLNFWTTWCGYCKQEMPDLEQLYKDTGLNAEEVVILGVGNPKTKDAPNNADVAEDEIIKFLTDSGYTYPTIMDRTGEMFAAYGITAFPTTFMIDVEGNVFGYLPGMMTREMMDNIIQQTKDAVPTAP